MVKKLEILVIEDTPEYLEKAKAVYSRDQNINVYYTLTYENAITELEKHKFDGVISDLFFPSQINWRDKFLREIKLGIIERDVEYNELARKHGDAETELDHPELDRNTLSLCKNNEGFLDEFNLNNFTIGVGDINFDDYRNLSENPSGLGIVLYCLQMKIPFTIISQGDRHRGNLGIVRYALQHSSTFKKLLDSEDPLPQISLYRGIMSEEISDKKYISKGIIDKGEELTWRDAIYAPYTGLLTRIKNNPSG